MTPEGKARCYSCREVLPVGEFAPDGSKASGRKSICRRCDRAKARRYYDRKQDGVLEKYRRRTWRREA